MWRGENTEKEEEEQEGNPNRLSARQELPFLTLPSVQENKRRGGEGRGKEGKEGLKLIKAA